MTKAEPAGRCHRGGTHDCFRRRRRSETDGRRQRQRSTHLSQGHLSHGRQSTTPWRRERSAASSPSSPDCTVQIRLRHPALVIIDHNSASVPASLPLTAAQGSSETVHCKLSSFVIDEKDVRPRWPKRYTALPAISRQVGQCETDTILTHGTFSAPPAGPLGHCQQNADRQMGMGQTSFPVQHFTESVQQSQRRCVPPEHADRQTSNSISPIITRQIITFIRWRLLTSTSTSWD